MEQPVTPLPFRFLVSFHYHQKTDLAEIVNTYQGPCEAFADSGAYSAASLGVTISLKEYAAWLKDWGQLLTVRATLDVIGDPDATMRNTHTLEGMGHQVLPVFHVGTPWDRLEKLCRDYDYVALGGMVPHSTNHAAVLRWLVRCFQIARETGTVFHGFGQTRLDTLKALPFYSVDSSAWGSGARFGLLYLWDDQAKDFVKLPVGDPAAARIHAALLRAHDADPRLVGTPGFGHGAHREQEQYAQENRMMRAVSAMAYMRMGQWLARRHRVPAPSVLKAAGTSVFLADAGAHNLHATAKGLASVQPLGTSVFLAETEKLNLHATIKGLNTMGSP